MKQASTLFLKGALLFMGAVVLALCVFALPSVWKGGSVEYPAASGALRLIVIGLYATTVPFFIALKQAWNLLGAIDRNSAFAGQSVRALKTITYCAIAIGVLYLGGVPLLVPIAEADDAPGLVLLGLVIACAPFVVAVFAAVLRRLFQSALEIKSENDLVV